MKFAHPRSRQAGFTIIELMVGIAMALLATFAIMSSYKAYEGQKRTTAAGSDTMVNSQFTVSMLEREMSLAGYGYQIGKTAVGCNFSGNWTVPTSTGVFPTVPADVANVATLQPGLNVQRLIPALIVDGGGTSPDALRFMYGNNNAPLPWPGGSTGVDGFLPQNSLIAGSGIFNFADMVVVGQVGVGADNQCQIGQVTNNVGKISLTNGGGLCLPAGACMTGSTFNSPNIIANGTGISDLGAFTVNSYFIRNNSLVQNAAILGVVYNGLTRVTTPPVISDTNGKAQQSYVGTGVINIQAQYGVDTVPDGTNNVNQWVEPTGTYAATALTASAVRQIRAVRFAVATRSALPENKLDSGGNCTATSVAAQPTNLYTVNWPDGSTSTIDLAQGATAATWRCYRYQVYSDVVPLRNLIWSTQSYESQS